MRNDRELFFRYFRMSPERFDHLLALVREQIEKEYIALRKSSPAAGRLVITLHYLASGETQQALSYSYRIRRSTVSTVIAKTCKAIYTALKRSLLEKSLYWEWLKSNNAIADRFEEVWNFPHVLGAIDKKHNIRIECPKLTGTLSHNCKGFFSLMLLAACDTDYCFTFLILVATKVTIIVACLRIHWWVKDLRQTPLTLQKTSL